MEINTSFGSGKLTIFLTGELDHHEARGVLKSVEELLDEYLPRDCVLNLAGLTFMDSSGIAVIIKAVRKIKTIGGNIRIECPAKQPQKVLDAAGIERLIPIALSR